MSAPLDPDRFFDHPAPGAHEWWYFDAISDDGRDALVVVWYAGLPFDPSYGMATLRHLRDPARHPAPRALDHAAIGLQWYRDGKTVAYALNGHNAASFRHQADPFGVAVGDSRFGRDGDGYHLAVATPAKDGRTPIRADLRFRPADRTEPFERDLGAAGAPHRWILAAADCRVEGRVAIGDVATTFAGRGYHDHNAGAEEMSRAMRRWEWGRAHHGPFTDVYYHAEPRDGDPRSLRITCRAGRPETVCEGGAFSGDRRHRTVYGTRFAPTLRAASGRGQLIREVRHTLDSGPFYLRWLATFAIRDGDGPEVEGVPGIAELLDTRNLNRPWFNWMIPYRLKWPRP